MSQDTKVYTDSLTANIGATLNGTLFADKKLGASAAGDILDLSAAQGLFKLGPTSTSAKFNWAWTTNTTQDTNGNSIVSWSKASISTATSVAHGYATATPTVTLYEQTTGATYPGNCTISGANAVSSASTTGIFMTADA